ncbi:Uma2 family endonuclease [Pseudonocardiaceae bacterium YIM PH 21723]|nr:Uma2 family endonuclease [Pseudonocardiaceae bacterium YIM PH 21723]
MANSVDQDIALLEHSLAIPYHPHPWTLDEVLALGDEQGLRVELCDGMLHVGPTPSRRHQRLLGRLMVAIDQVLPRELELLPAVNVLLSDSRLVVPDLSVNVEPGGTGAYVPAEQVALVVEVLSASSRLYDTGLKRQVYADAGIKHYLLVDPDAASATLLELDFGEYSEVNRSAGGILYLTDPFTAELDLRG